MPIFIDRADLTFVSVPKCACSSMKHFMHEVKTGQKFEETEGQSIHDLYPSVGFSELEKAEATGNVGGKFYALVRHPVDRIVSAFADKIATKNVLSRKKESEQRCRDLGIPTQPDLETFIERLDDYRSANGMIRQHTQELSFFLGSDATKFSRLFRLQEIDELCALICERAGSVVGLQHLNKKKGARSKLNVSPAVRAEITRRFSGDFNLFGEFLGTD